MKFSTKIFLNTIITVLLSLVTGGVVLLTVNFRSALNMQIKKAQEESRVLAGAAAYVLVDITDAGRGDIRLGSAVDDVIQGSMKNSEDLFQIRNWNTQAVYGSGKKLLELTENEKILGKATEEKAAYRVLKTEAGWRIQTVCVATVNGQKYFMEYITDSSEVYRNRDRMQQALGILILIVGIICGGINYIQSKWLTKPILKLNRVTKEIAGGRLGLRSEIISRDEIGELSENFNKMTEQLEGTILDLRQTAKKQEDFMGNFSHELKTPLTSMIGYADFLRSSKVTEDEVFEAANYIYYEGQRLEALSRQMLELMLEKGNAVNRKKENMLKIIEGAVFSIHRRLEEEGKKIEIDMEEADVTVNFNLFKTVMINLLDNARKAVEENDKIFITGHKEGEGYVITVRDNGKGIPKEDIARLTEPFYMVDKSRDRRKGGVGLGLAICSQILDLHQGTIEFESELGKGTSVTVRLGGEEIEE